MTITLRRGYGFGSRAFNVGLDAHYSLSAVPSAAYKQRAASYIGRATLGSGHATYLIY